MAEYIDRKALIEHLEKDPLYDLVEQYGVTGVIESFPAADVQPVKHGRWIDGDYRCVTAVCSKCKHLRLGNGAKFATRIALYCEHCGARMDGES